jgi:hypothetical protein
MKTTALKIAPPIISRRVPDCSFDSAILFLLQHRYSEQKAPCGERCNHQQRS